MTEFEETILKDIDTKGWRSLIKYVLDIPEGQETRGFKIFYQAANGQLYSAFYPAADYVDRHLDEMIPFEIGVPQDKEYYYWADKDVANAYMLALKRKMKNKPLQGSFVMRPVSGIALKRGKDEGDRMTSMIIEKSDID